MELHQLIYVSRLTANLTSESLRAIVHHSAKANAAVDVTGVLLVQGRSAMQLLEGTSDALETLYTKIARDPRHADVGVILRKAIGRRLYPEWGMGLADLRSGLELDRPRMVRMIDDIRAMADTRQFSIEARVLVRDFEQQAAAA